VPCAECTHAGAGLPYRPRRPPSCRDVDLLLARSPPGENTSSLSGYSPELTPSSSVPGAPSLNHITSLPGPSTCTLRERQQTERHRNPTGEHGHDMCNRQRTRSRSVRTHQCRARALRTAQRVRAFPARAGAMRHVQQRSQRQTWRARAADVGGRDPVADPARAGVWMRSGSVEHSGESAQLDREIEQEIRGVSILPPAPTRAGRTDGSACRELTEERTSIFAAPRAPRLCRAVIEDRPKIPHVEDRWKTCSLERIGCRAIAVQRRSGAYVGDVQCSVASSRALACLIA